MTNDLAWIASCVTLVLLGNLWLLGHVVSLALSGRGLGVQRKPDAEPRTVAGRFQ